MYAILGWILVAAVIIMAAPYWLRIPARIFGIKGAGYKRLIKILRAVHKPLGAALVVIVVVHGFLALGVCRLHTGVIAGAFLIITAAFGGAFFIFKKKRLFMLHRLSALLLSIFVLVHLIFPSAVFYLFGI